MGKLEGKIAVVTGAGSGIGRASAVLFAAEGASVVVADVDREGGEETAARIAAAGGSSAFVATDVRSSASVRSLIDAAVARFARIDVLFNNAGIGGDYAPLADCSEENFDRIVAVNLRGVFLGMKYGIQAMLKSGGGVVVNTASVSGIAGAAAFPAYCASKAGVILLTKSAAVAYAKAGIRLNCLCPGVTDTPILRMIPQEFEGLSYQHPMKRKASCEEMARAALFLACDDSSFATGTELVVDGGFTAQ
jgi:NAD(P)-dependent dehydrogenase (short-subunit alcohol dehydrogenase family)